MLSSVKKNNLKLKFFQLVTHLRCHTFNEKKNDEEECARIAAICLSYKHYLRCIDHYQKIEIKFYTTLFVCILFALPCFSAKCVYMCFYAPIPLHAITVRLSALSSAVIILISIYIFISDSFRKNHSIHDPRRTQRY